MPTVAEVTSFLDDYAPLTTAAEWDNVGLLLGDGARPVRRLMTCLTVTPESAAEAVAEQVDLIVTHHPILFRPVKSLTTATSEGRMLLDLARAGIAVYSPHTAFDNTAGGINEIIASRLGLREVAPLRPQPGEDRCKIVVFVPEEDLAPVSAALFRAGAGHIGRYSECSFRTTGIGTFFGSDSTNPTVGVKGRREEVTEWRLEAICPAPQVEQAIAAMRAAHSYEEPAYDVYPLRPVGSASGEGRVGVMSHATPLTEVGQVVKTALSANLVQIIGDRNRAVSRVAIVCGAGGDFLRDAVRARADVLLTGELRFHDYLAAHAQGIALILPGHYASERFAVEELGKKLQQHWPDLAVWASRREQNPVWSV